MSQGRRVRQALKAWLDRLALPALAVLLVLSVLLAPQALRGWLDLPAQVDRLVRQGR